MKIFPSIKLSSVALFNHVLSGMVGYHIDRHNGFREINHKINCRSDLLNQIDKSILTINYLNFINSNRKKTIKSINLVEM